MPSSDRPAAPATTTLDVDTSVGLARVHYDVPAPTTQPAGRLLLGHGAGGGVHAKDLARTRDVALAAGWAVALVEQPWRVAGKKVAAPPPRLDVAWLEVVATLVEHPPFAPGPPLVLGGRSAGARVACRTVDRLGARGVLCLAFPLHPPGKPEKSRAHELALVADRPLLVVQGERDPFGTPDDVRRDAPGGAVVAGVAGDHSLARDLAAVAAAVGAFLEELTEGAAPAE